jgi:hypothetical protein
MTGQLFKLKECNWKIRLTKVDADDIKHELLNRLRSTMAVNVVKAFLCNTYYFVMLTVTYNWRIHTEYFFCVSSAPMLSQPAIILGYLYITYIVLFSGRKYFI